MTAYSTKISALPNTVDVPEATIIPVVAEQGATEQIDVRTLRSVINFEHAYTTPAEGSLATAVGQVFFVYTDDNKTEVKGYVSQGGSTFIPLTDNNGNQITYPTNKLLALIPTLVATVNSFDALRNTIPLFDGQVANLKGWREGSTAGAGTFVGRVGSKVDDSGIIAAGEGFYWERQLTDPVMRPEMFGGVGGSNTTDNTDAILACVAAAKTGRSQIDFRGGPWRITRTVDLSGIFGIRTDVGGRFLVNPENFTPAHNANYAVVFGNPDTPYGSDRVANCSVVGTFQINSDNRNKPLNGIYLKGALMTFNSMRAVNFNGSGVYMSACWDSKFDSISVENCGNVTSFAFQIAAGGDTSNCLFIGRIQAETSFHKQISINVIRSEIHTIHAERMYILTTDDGTTSLPSGLNYLNTAILMSNSILGQVVIDALDSAANNTVTTTPSVSLNLYSSKATSLQMVSSIVVSTYGLYGTIENSSFLGYYNIANPIVMDNCKISNANGTGVLKIIKGEIRNCTIDTITPHYGTDGLLISNSTINNDIDITAVPVKNIVFRNCNIIGTVKRTDSPASNGYAPTTFIDCQINTVAGYWQHRCTIIGGYVTNVNLVDRAYVEFINVAGGTFNCGAQIGFITFNCNFNTVTKWAPCSLGIWPIGKITQRLGDGDGVSSLSRDWLNTTDGGATFNKVKSSVTPEMFGAKANGTNDDTAAILLALNYAYTNNLTCKFEGGTYYGTTVSINYPVSVEVAGGAFLNFNFVIQGTFVEAKNSVATTLTWAQVPVGTTSIAGNFSAFTVGGIVAIKLNDITGGSAAQGNEAGFDFSSISAVSGTTLTLSTATRLAYQSPDIIEVNKGIAYTGTLAADTYSVAGNYTSLFAVGDVIRIENLGGTDSVEAKSFYFEYAKIASISTTAMTFKSRLQYAHVNPWFIKTGFIKSPKIIGKGRLKRLEIRQADTPIVDGLDIDRLIVGNTYDCTTMNINSRGVGEPSSVNHSFCFGRGRIHGLRVGGSVSTTDNASCKLMSCPGMIVSDVLSDNTTSTGSQGDYGFYIDAYYTPYRCWNKNITVNNVIAELPRSSVTRGIWFYGMKNSTIKNLSGAQVFLQGSIDSVFESINTPDSAMEVRDLVRCRVSGVVNSLSWLGCFYSSLDVMIKSISTATSSLNMACRVGAGTTNPEDGTTYTVGLFNRFDVISNSQSTSAITFSIGNQTSFVIGNKCRDLSTVANSVVFGSNVTDPRMEGNFLAGPIQSSSAWAGVRFVGGFNLDGNYSMSAIKWNGQYMFLASDGTLKRTLAKPTSDSPSDQTIIGP